MRRLALVLALLFIPAASVSAQEAPEATLMEVDGVQGLWMPLDAAQEALSRWREVERLRALTDIQGQRLRLQEQTISILRRSLYTAREDLDRSLSMLNRAQTRSQRKWWENQILWLSLGLVLGMIGST